MNKHQQKNIPALPSWMKRLYEGGFILMVTFALFIFFALITYQATDPGWFHRTTSDLIVLNAGGRVGAYMADFLYTLLGYAAFSVPVVIAYLAWVMLHEHRHLVDFNKPMLALRGLGVGLLLIGICGLLVFCMDGKPVISVNPGGSLGRIIATWLHQFLNSEGALLSLLAAALIGVTWLTGLSWIRFIEAIGRATLWFGHVMLKVAFLILNIGQRIFSRVVALSRAGWHASCVIIGRCFRGSQKSLQVILAWRTSQRTKTIGWHVNEMSPSQMIEKSTPSQPSKNEAKSTRFRVLPTHKTTPEKPTSPPRFTAPVPENSQAIGSLPSLELLAKNTSERKPAVGYTHQALETLSHELEQHLLDFGIQANVVAAYPGPVITRFELQLAAGVKVSKLSTLAKDLARSLSVVSVRVVEIIPGKTVVGLELPNPERTIVVLSEVLASETYQKAYSPLTLALGVDIAGHPMIVDLAKMPHLLVAGTTGSGKSVGINAMILSLLFKSTPEQVRLILIDPKMLELSVYDGIPHLLTPVVTDMKEAASALRWCVEEMERRYRLMAALGVRNLAGFNTKILEAIADGKPLVDPFWKLTDGMSDTAPELQSLPYIVVVIDELADMMMVVGKKVEQLIARIAQKARAAGIHLILATQRPSVDVLTGLIKSNIPTRISFQVSSKIDSRTILDQQGAEQLLGHGDMLFLAPGTGSPLRVHGAFVDDAEVHRVADDWRRRGQPVYIDVMTEDYSDMGDSSRGESVEESDPLYDEAVAFVMQTRKASTSSVQRRFKIGYNRAARLIDEMERVGIVGPLDGGQRDVLVTSQAEG